MLKGLSAGHTQKKPSHASVGAKNYSSGSFFFFFLKPQSDMPGLALISLLSALEQRAW